MNSNAMNRRDFLRLSAWTGLAAAVASPLASAKDNFSKKTEEGAGQQEAATTKEKQEKASLKNAQKQEQQRQDQIRQTKKNFVKAQKKKARNQTSAQKKAQKRWKQKQPTAWSRQKGNALRPAKKKTGILQKLNPKNWFSKSSSKSGTRKRKW